MSAAVEYLHGSDSCRADAHELSCGNCGSFDVVCQPFTSDLQPFTPMTTMNNNHDMDLTNVVNLKLLSPYQIRTMETATRDSLKLKLKDEDIVGLDVVQLAALNPLNKTVDYLGEEDTIDRVSSVAKFQGYLDDRSWVGDRYYLIFRGRDFTGVVRGLCLHEDHELPKSIAHSGGQAFDSRVDAEYAWLQGYYAGICGKVCKAVVDPDVPLFLQS
jgi:hypothetical protein